MGKRSGRAVSGYREQSDPKYARVLVSFKRRLIDPGPYRPAKRSMSSRLLLPAPPVRPLLMPPPAWDVVPYEPIPEAVEDPIDIPIGAVIPYVPPEAMEVEESVPSSYSRVRWRVRRFYPARGIKSFFL